MVGRILRNLSAVLVVVVFAQVSLASLIACPSTFRKTVECNAAPKSGDSRIVTESFKKVWVCESSKQSALVFEISNKPAIEAVRVERKSGSVTYAMTDVEKDGDQMIVSLSHPTNAKKVTGKITAITVEGETQSANYSCAIQ